MNSNLFCGIDASFAGTAVTVLDNGYNIIEQKLISTKRHDGPYDIEKRMLRIVDELKFILKYKDNLKLTIIEGISYGSSGESSIQLASLNYFIRIFLFTNNFTYTEVAPTKLKKFVTGKGMCKKNLMLKEVYKKWKVDFDDDNICDSYAITRYAVEIYKNKKFN